LSSPPAGVLAQKRGSDDLDAKNDADVHGVAPEREPDDDVLEITQSMARGSLPGRAASC